MFDSSEHFLQAFARAYQSHPTWHLQHAELSKGWEYMLQGVLARAEVKRQERLAADVALILKCLKEMIELAEQEREKSAEVPMGNKVVELPPIRAWVTEMLQGAEPGPIGTALISVFESLGGEESKV
jgi:hypothetical protein